MGCGASKNKIDVVESAGSPRKNTHVDVISPGKDRTKSGKSNKSKDAWGSQDSLGNDSLQSGQDRGNSATSKVSKHSGDSGFDDEAYAKVVTESSNPDVVRQMIDEFKDPQNLDFGVVGKQCPQRRSAKERRAETAVLDSLREEGFIQRPVSRAAFGISYDIVTDDLPMLGQHCRPPPRLAKLERRKKKKKELTAEQLAAKMEKTETRRKEREQQKLAKIMAMTTNAKTNDALNSFAERQQKMEETVKSKQDLVTENREKKMLELKEKLRLKEERAAAVRERRKLMAGDSCEPEETEPGKRRTFSEDTPVGVSVKC